MGKSSSVCDVAKACMRLVSKVVLKLSRRSSKLKKHDRKQITGKITFTL